jgi:RNA polymerase sigma-70 factor (ECF subfamily)
MTVLWAELPLARTANKTASMREPASAPTVDDETLVAETLAGNHDAFAELVARYRRRVFHTAARFARDHHQLDDIAQEVFVRAFRHLAKFRRDAPFAHWLARITVSACYDFLRKERRVREQVPLDAQHLDLRDAGAEAGAAARRARELLDVAMRRLSPPERLVLTLCELEERPVREVALLTGWSESNVKVRAFRARQNLKRILETAHDERR